MIGLKPTIDATIVLAIIRIVPEKSRTVSGTASPATRLLHQIATFLVRIRQGVSLSNPHSALVVT
jgi:hypothetical protein